MGFLKMLDVGFKRYYGRFIDIRNSKVIIFTEIIITLPNVTN